MDEPVPQSHLPLRHQFDMHVVGDAVTGLWCSCCALPSGYELFVVVTPRLNPTFVVHRGTFWQCDSCACRRFTAAP